VLGKLKLPVVFLKRIVFVFILMSLLKIEHGRGLALTIYLGGSQLASGPDFGGEVLTPPSYTKSRRPHATTPVTLQPRSTHIHEYAVQAWWYLMFCRCRSEDIKIKTKTIL